MYLHILPLFAFRCEKQFTKENCVLYYVYVVPCVVKGARVKGFVMSVL